MKDDKENLAKATIHGTFWGYASTYSSKLIVLISTTILARVLLQEDFGVAGYALVVMSFLDIINGLGIGPAIIYYPKDKERTNCAFWLGLAIGIALFALAWVIAPLAGKYFNDARAIPVTRVLALAFPFSALGIVHEALLRKELAFKLKAIPDFARAVSKGIVSIVMAILGFGVWSIIFGQLVGVVFSVILYWWIIPWRPSLRLNPNMVRSLLSYGLNIVSVRALSAVLLNTDFLLVGRFLGTAALGTYTLAVRVPNILIGQFADVIGQVLFPVYAKMGNDSSLFKKGLFMTIRYVSMITLPIGLGLALVAEPFVLTLFTEKWADAIPIAMVRVCILVPALWWAVTGPGTLIAVGWTVVVVAFVGMVIQLIVARRILQISFVTILEALRPAAIGAAAMALAVLGVLVLCAGAAPFVKLVITVSFGGITYVGVLWWFHRDVVVTAAHALRQGLVRR
jgi:PST family polysaccharide transporter